MLKSFLENEGMDEILIFQESINTDRFLPVEQGFVNQITKDNEDDPLEFSDEDETNSVLSPTPSIISLPDPASLNSLLALPGINSWAEFI